jgi:hypothetical protein
MSRDALPSLRAAWPPWALALGAVGTLAGALILHGMGRRLWCACGSPVPWSWNIWSEHNSQHLLDPYTFTHVLHGVLFYAVLWSVFRARWPAARALLALAVEVAWEIAENTDAVIESYRESTISLNYYGDSVANSVADVLAFALGYALALKLPARVSVAACILVELALLLTIRDSLLLNVVMLVYPIEALKTWQMGG